MTKSAVTAKVLVNNLEKLHLNWHAEVTEFSKDLVGFVNECTEKSRKTKRPLSEIIIPELASVKEMTFKKAKENIGKLRLLHEEIKNDPTTFQLEHRVGPIVGNTSGTEEGTTCYALRQVLSAAKHLYTKEFNSKTLAKLNTVCQELSNLQYAAKLQQASVNDLNQITQNLGIGSCVKKSEPVSYSYVSPFDKLVSKIERQRNNFAQETSENPYLDTSVAKSVLTTTQTSIQETLAKLAPTNPLSKALESVLGYMLGPVENIATRIFHGNEDIFNPHGLFETTFGKDSQRTHLIESQRLLHREEQKIEQFENQFQPLRPMVKAG